MTTIAIAMVLASAFFHATWNFVAKRAQGGASFVWLFGVLDMFIYLPFVVYLIVAQDASIGFEAVIFMFGSGVLHLFYFVMLSRGYQVGDLSVVYPLARALGPLIASGAAILLFHERPTALALGGGLLIRGGVFWLTGDPRRLLRGDALPGVALASITGLSIAAYTLWDAYAVSKLLLMPLIYQWGIGGFRTLMLAPHALRHWDEVRHLWRCHRWAAVFIAIFSSLSYLLMLAALAFSPVSYAAPLRVVSTLIGVVMGAHFLREGNLAGRLSAAGVMVLGVFALSIG